MFLEKKIVGADKIFLPTTNIAPSIYTTELVASTSGAQSTTYTVTESGFYEVIVNGAGGLSPYLGTGGIGGGVTTIVYLYKGTKCLLWSGSAGSTSTSYPGGTTDDWGGTGATGQSEGGGGGGGAAHGGRTAYANGSPGSGFIAGIDKNHITKSSHREPEWSKAVSTMDSLSVNGFSVGHIYSVVLAGAGGGGSSDEGSSRSGGGGGGAFGNGGDTYSAVTGATTGPGGTWGKGENSDHYGPGGRGAYAVLDFSRNQWYWGLGGGSNANGSGMTSLYKVFAASVIFESSTPGTYEITIPKTGNYDIKLVGGGGTGVNPFVAMSDFIYGSGAYVYGITELQAGTYTVTVGAKGPSNDTAGSNTVAFEQVAGGGPYNITDQATYTVSLPGLSGILGNKGGIAQGGESLYDGYGRGGARIGRTPAATDGYIKIAAV